MSPEQPHFNHEQQTESTRPELHHSELRERLLQLQKNLQIMAEDETTYAHMLKEDNTIPAEYREHFLQLVEATGETYTMMLDTADQLFEAFEHDETSLNRHLEQLEREHRKANQQRAEWKELEAELRRRGDSLPQDLIDLSSRQKDLARDIIETHRLIGQVHQARDDERVAYNQRVPFMSEWHSRNLTLRNGAFALQQGDRTKPETKEPGEESRA